MGYSPWGCKELDMTERLTHTHVQCGDIHKFLDDVVGGTGESRKEPEKS